MRDKIPNSIFVVNLEGYDTRLPGVGCRGLGQKANTNPEGIVVLSYRFTVISKADSTRGNAVL